MDDAIGAEEAGGGKNRTPDRIGRIPGSVQNATRIFSSRVSASASHTKQRLEGLASKTPDPYDEAVAEYNIAFTAMQDTGLSLLRQRERSTDLIVLVAMLVNSLANTPKSFRTDFEEVLLHKKEFSKTEDLARKNLEAARRSAVGAGAGFAAGAAVGTMAPTAAMWAATTLGTASTGTAISTLSGAAASNAALAWLGGGAVAAGGGGAAAGSAILALAGPIGWTIAGATLLTTVVLFSKKKSENRAAKEEALAAVKQNVARVQATEAKISFLLRETCMLRESLTTLYAENVHCFNADFPSLAETDQLRLAALVNNTKACASLLGRHISQDSGHG